ncbi:(2Fe-2S)-binding protein [Pseudomonas sp. BJa5]|uniref:(2Fe-2S)-binding protein n=1 Tax=Pseudomonas sp. BJa5 TaxID=2936270 RepID=UPI002559BA0F|nr:(2Fe-2S)-binding protein [Pseudomonas sp. BGr12]MDL2419589.1 (2Fe-2S)-binding protein [Pseudomonas sp. BGr12]
MPTKRLFTPMAGELPGYTIEFDGCALSVPGGVSLAAALLASGIRSTRTTPVTGRPRAPYCLMGVCFECLVEVDGVPNCQACMIAVRDGMRVRTQNGARALACDAQARNDRHES